MKYETAATLRVLPLHEADGKLVLAASTEMPLPEQRALRLYFTRSTTLEFHEDAVIRRAVFLAYRGGAEEVQRSHTALQDYEAVRQCKTAEGDASLPEARGEPAAFLHALLLHAAAQRATDLHLTPSKEGSRLALRVHGDFLSHEEVLCSLATHHELVQRLRILSRLSTTVKGVPQDGSFIIEEAGLTLRVRVSIVPTIHGDKASLRFLGVGERRTLDDLFLPMVLSGWCEEILSRGQGSILVSGPTGSGKTTLLYALVEEALRTERHVVTIEDPVEIIVPRVTQIAVSAQGPFDYPTALKAVLRHDPDVLMVGEVRDRESAEAALQLALTGHLLLATVHGGSVFDVLLRLNSLGISPKDLSHSVSLIVNLRLVNTLHTGDSSGGESLRARSGKSTQRFLTPEALLIDDKVKEAIALGRLSHAELISTLTAQNYISRAASHHFVASSEMMLKGGGMGYTKKHE